MRLRNTILQYQFFQRLNSAEEMTPARTYWLRNKNNTITASLALRFSKENAIHMMNNNLSQLSQKDKRDIIVCELEARSRGMNNIGSSITFDTNLKLRACFQADVLTNRNSRILINRWLCGNIANHQTCKKCQSTASRRHVIQCSGIETSIMSIDPVFKLCHSSFYNAMDQAFQFLYHNSNSASYDVMANCIKKIYIECLGYQQADNGYWSPEALTETHAPNNRRTTVRAPNESTARPKRALRISDNYSVASRAPDPRQYLATLTQQNLLPQLQEAQQESPQTLPRLPELDRRTSQRVELLPPFRTFLDTLARRERQQLTRRPDHNNNRVHMRSRRDGFIWTYEYMPHMQYYQEPH
jgi:hypothetical protein